MDAPILDLRNIGAVSNYSNVEEVDGFRHRVDEIFSKVDKVRIYMLLSYKLIALSLCLFVLFSFFFFGCCFSILLASFWFSIFKLSTF